MDKYIKLDLLAKGCKSNTIYLVKNLDDNKVNQRLLLLVIRFKKDHYRHMQRRTNKSK